MKIARILLPALISLSATAFANNWYDRGNGGFVFLCESQPSIVVDLQENESRGLGPVQFSKATTATEKALDIIRRLEKLDPSRAALYKSWVKDFFLTAQFLKTSSLKHTPDLGLVTIPAGCKLEQPVFQRNPSILNSFRFTVNEDVWEQLDTDNQAALIVHEVIYREFMNSPAKEMFSERVRILNSILHADALKDLSRGDYLALLQDLHIAAYEHDGLTFATGFSLDSGDWVNLPVVLNRKGEITSGSLLAEQAIARPYFSYACQKSSVALLGYATLENSRLTSFDVNPAFIKANECRLPNTFVPGAEHSIEGQRWLFGAGEKPAVISRDLAAGTRTEMNYKGWSYQLIPNFFRPEPVQISYSFDENVNLKAIDFGGTPCVMNSQKVVRFTQSNLGSPSTVGLTTKGAPEKNLPACY